MTAPQPRTVRRRFRLGGNHNETIIPAELDEFDVEGHRLATNDNETVVEGAVDADASADGGVPGPDGLRR